MRAALFIVTCFFAAGVPLFTPPAAPPVTVAFPGWPAEFEGRRLTALPLRKYEKEFEADFPGRIGRFSDGEREIVFRYVAEKTRKLHPGTICFTACGYTVQPCPLWTGEGGVRWGHYMATRANDTLFVYERIYDATEKSWTDTSAWYWAAVLGETNAPWWSVIVAQTQKRQK